MTADALDAALEQFARRGPEFGPGLSNHGPMAAEALVALGRDDVIEPWAEWYAARLDDAPERRTPIDRDGWRDALGDIRRAGDWTLYFERELSERAWHDVLEEWIGRLVPGIMAGATHGILRTAHAVRSLDRGENAQRTHELAEGLGYWAARYQELPSSKVSEAAPRERVGDALRRVDRVDASVPRRGLIFDVVKNVEPQAFGPVIEYADTSVAVDAFVSDVTRTFVRQYLANANNASIAFVHTVTAPSALRILAPYLSDATTRAAMRYAWQACAAIYAAYGGGVPPGIDEAASVDRDDLIDRAVAARDEHAIKFTEACLREYTLTPDPAFLLAAEDAVRRLRAN
jgi:hypothetical protein